MANAILRTTKLATLFSESTGRYTLESFATIIQEQNS